MIVLNADGKPVPLAPIDPDSDRGRRVAAELTALLEAVDARLAKEQQQRPA